MTNDPREHIRQQLRFQLLHVAVASMAVFLLRAPHVEAVRAEQ